MRKPRANAAVAEMVVLDASALLALMMNETGADVVSGNLPGAAMSSVNLAEVAGKLKVKGMPEHEIRGSISYFGMEILSFGLDDAIELAKVHAITRDRGLSLGDCACLALGSRLEAEIITADRAWQELDLELNINVIR